MAKTVILIKDINIFVTAIKCELRLWRNDMDYQAVRKKYTLYTRVAGILTMVLILCVAFAVSDIPMRTWGVLVIVAGLALAIYLINKWYLTTVAKLLHTDLDLASWEQYIETNKEAKRAVLRLSLAYMTGDGDSKGQRNLESGRTSTTIPKRLAKLFNPFSRVEPAGAKPRRAGGDDW